MWGVKKAALAVTSLAAGITLALQPYAASAVTSSMILGSSYEGCNEIEGDYDYVADGSAGGKVKYDTAGWAQHSYYGTCDSWNDGPGVFQYTGYRYRSGAWSQIAWTSLRDSTGQYDLAFNDVRDIRFRICNRTDGKITGCELVN